MPFQVQKTRLKSDPCHRIGDHWTDVAAEVNVDIVGFLGVIFVLIDHVMNGKERGETAKQPE